MSYIGNQPTSIAFLTDQFSGDGTTTSFTMKVAPANSASVLVVISGVVQDPVNYSVVGMALNFSTAPPAGTNNISVRYLGIPASGVTTTTYRTVTDFTATAGQTTFIPPSYTPGYINVYRNGVRLGLTDYTATNGTTVILVNAASVNDLVTTESFYVSSVLNAIPAQAGQVGASYLANGGASQAFLDVGTGTGTGALKLPVGTTAQRPTGATGMIRQNSTTGNPEWWDATTSTWLQFSQPVGYSVNYLVVAGGASGGAYGGGGGGAGGMLTSSATLSSSTIYTITVGAGGAGVTGTTASSTSNPKGNNGSNSSISTIATAIGGGGGGQWSSSGLSGGSGGGTGKDGSSASGGSGTSGQGFAGGASLGASAYGSSGGGGAGGTGSNGLASEICGAGGVGVANSISGSAVYYAGGGGGGSNGASGTNGVGGNGGGGAGGYNATSGTSGTANTGGGGGGCGWNTGTSGNGGSGIVIISYLGSQRGTGGTVTSSGGFTIHTFTSSGTYTA